jgi:endoglucanase
MEKSRSIQFAELLGIGVNLGNTFDAFDRINHTEIDDETAWGQPKVMKEYMRALVNHGFKSIRIPFTAFTRIGNAPDYTITESFLQRYNEVVDYALNEGLYVMINLHHDSSEWLIHWDGNENSEEYTKFIALWTQLATRFQSYDDRLIFESINEPFFDKSIAPTDDEQNDMLRRINLGFYNLVRAMGGNNTTRTLVFPTLYTNDSLIYSRYLSDYILRLDDENVLATVHWYASNDTYAFTANIGVQSFDEQIKGIDARTSTTNMFNNLRSAFGENNIGVIIGEFGLFNQGLPGCLNDGEVYKFKEFLIGQAKELSICPMLWDVGLILDRHNGEWVNKIWGEILTASMTARSSYATGLNYIFIREGAAITDIEIQLNFNNNTLVDIYNGSYKLIRSRDYSVERYSITLSANYLSTLEHNDYGTIADLRFEFSSGSVWHEYVNYIGTPSLDIVQDILREDNGYLASYDTDKTATYPKFIIPGRLQGGLIRRIESLNDQGQPQSANTWASDYMQYGGEFKPVVKAAAYNQDIIAFMNWYNDAIDDDKFFTLVIDFFDGTQMQYSIIRSGGRVIGKMLPVSK